MPRLAAVMGKIWWDRTWLQAAGSLTARLHTLGQVHVHVLSQGPQPLWPSEQASLQTRNGHVREVVLTLDGQAVVWARSATSSQGLKGPWKAIKGLGNRPLAELLFNHAQVIRGPLRRVQWRKASAEHGRALRMWRTWLAQHPHAQHASPPWQARASVFWHKGQALRVLEAFSPDLANWQGPL